MKARLNPATVMYEWPDGTKAAAEVVDNVACLADILNIANIRERSLSIRTPEAEDEQAK